MMDISIHIGRQTFRVSRTSIDIAIPMHFNGPQPNTYGVPGAQSSAYEGGGFVGDVRQGGSCNFETYSLTPHCNGTHTECVGHIAADRISVHDSLTDTFIPATLISLNPTRDTADSYLPFLNAGDWVLDRKMLEQALASTNPQFWQALVIRTLPNAPTKKSRDYMEIPPPFFTLEAMEFIRACNVRHLLIDMPSVDRLFDNGHLSAHHIFWEVELDSHLVTGEITNPATITEMIYVPDQVPDGPYLLNLQIAPFMADAAPSRPRLFSIQTH